MAWMVSFRFYTARAFAATALYTLFPITTYFTRTLHIHVHSMQTYKCNYLRPFVPCAHVGLSIPVFKYLSLLYSLCSLLHKDCKDTRRKRARSGKDGKE